MNSPQYELADFARDVDCQGQFLLGPPACGVGKRPPILGTIYGHLVEERRFNCNFDELSSRVCQRGTKCCTVDHDQSPLDKSGWIKPDPEVIRLAREAGIIEGEPVKVTVTSVTNLDAPSSREGRATFEFSITYFKMGGKFYTSRKVSWEVPTSARGGPYMPDVAAKVRGLRDTGGQAALPGLCGEGWNGFILVDCEEGHPVLILPFGMSPSTH